MSARNNSSLRTAVAPPRGLLLLLVTTLMALLAGCGDDGGKPGTALGDSGVDGDDGGGELDAEVDTIATFDSGGDSDDTGLDTDADDADEPGLIGDLCVEEFDCAEALLCVDILAGEEGAICTQLCTRDEDCPDDYDCVFSSEGADTRQICLPVDLCIDQDDDGFGIGPGCLGRDCDDTTELANPQIDEVCDGLDNDCDEVTDENTIDTGGDCPTGFAGICAEGVETCLDGLVDCVPRLVARGETCNGIDDDCDGQTDEDPETGAPLSRSCFDADPDLIGVGACTAGVQTCVDGGYSGCVGQVTPAVESCNEVDDDCNGEVDDEVVYRNFWRDADRDGFGDPASTPRSLCALEIGWADNDDDCNDSRRDVNPGIEESPADGLDANCDETELCFLDVDGDGFHDGTVVVSARIACDGPDQAGIDPVVGDCNDRNPDAFPGAEEVIGDGVDQDCDRREICWVDGDGDGARIDETVESADTDCTDDGEGGDETVPGDCADDDDDRSPAFVEVCDAIDNDCNERIDDGVGCYDDGAECEDYTDCSSGFCTRDGLCAPPGACADGDCPTRAALSSGGASLSGPSFGVDIEIGSPMSFTRRDGPNFSVAIGVGVYRHEP